MKTKIICYCGSLRKAMDAFKKAEYEAVLRQEIALLPCCMFVDIQRDKRKIDICDEVFVLNVGGYIGESTQSEIDYALSIGKQVKYLEPGNCPACGYSFEDMQTHGDHYLCKNKDFFKP